MWYSHFLALVCFASVSGISRAQRGSKCLGGPDQCFTTRDEAETACAGMTSCDVFFCCKTEDAPAPATGTIKVPGFKCAVRRPPGVAPTPCPTPSMAPSNDPNPGTPTPTPTGAPNAVGGWNGDVHMGTYDGLRYDCQAKGEMVLARSASKPRFQIQGRFRQNNPGNQRSVTNGIAIEHEGGPTLQFSFRVNPKTRSTPLHGGKCPLVFMVNGKVKSLKPGERKFGKKTVVTFNPAANTFEVALPSGMTVRTTVHYSNYWKCFMNGNHLLPGAVSRTAEIEGLLGGVPNGKQSDDWIRRDGTFENVPASERDRLFEPAYSFCTREWCIRDDTESIFTYEKGTDHAFFENCDAPPDQRIDFATVPREIQEACGVDFECILDAEAGGNVADGLIVLQHRQELREQVQEMSELKFDPADIQNGAPVTTKITMDVSKKKPAQVAGLDKFTVYQVDDEGERVDNGQTFDLLDNGESSFDDDRAGDLVFSNRLAFQLKEAGQALNFEAVPVIDGEESANNELARTSKQAIESFSKASGIGKADVAETTVSVESIDGMELKVSFSWKNFDFDLDTATLFSGDIGGFSCFGAQLYVEHLGEAAGSSGGLETSLVFLERAREDGLWTDSTEVTFRAGWFIEGPEEPVALSVVLQNSATKKEVAGTRLSTAVVPGSQFDCAEKEVAKLSISVGAQVSLTLKRL